MKSITKEFLALMIWLACVYGWGANLFKLFDYDFEPAYKAEALRITGVIVAPVGIIMGYLTIEDKCTH